MIPREVIDEIIARNDIEQTIGSYVSLKRAGSNMNGLCPFHSEKSPSFTVFPATRSFYCFGCGAGGDVISFIMRQENLDYVGALELLASRAGIEIPSDRNALPDKGVPRARVYEMNLAAARFFRECLLDEQYGKEGLRYLHEERGLSMATIRHFGLGFAPDHWWALTNHMRRLGFTEEELIEGFLCKRSEKSGKIFDLFRNRVIFPVIDTSGNIIAFGGRVMDDSKPKYLNSSDTPAFKKSRHLFALNFAKKQCAERMILCEGYMDVIALHAAGFENAVATLGTAITSEQARVFAKYTKQVVICYDSDAAGQTAASKAMRLLGEVGVDVRVLKLSGAKDPDEYIKKFGQDSFRRVLDSSMTGFEFRLEKILSEYNLQIAEEKIRASNAVCGMIAEAHSHVERDIYVKKAADRLELSADALRTDVERIRRRRASDARKKDAKDAQLSIKHIGDRVNVDSAKNIRATQAEEALLGLMLMFEEFRREAADGRAPIRAEDFSTEFGRRVFSEICRLERGEYGFSKGMLAEHFSPDELGRIEKMEVDRRLLNRNDRDVFLAAIDTIKEEHSRTEESDDFAEELRKRQEAYQARIKNKNT
ncbi:MAG: DNA primase [Clostridia bacterium]|nr:DNA primase [Clostridia bacterium]